MGLSIHSFGLCGWKRTKQIVLAEESIHRHRLERSYKRLHRRCDESFLDKSVDQKAEKTDQEYTNCIHTAKRPLELKIEPSGLNWQKLEKRGLFSLPYISHNVHYTKLMSLKNRPPLLPCSTRTALPGGSFFVSVSGCTPLQVQAMCVAPGLVYSGSGVISKYVQMAS